MSLVTPVTLNNPLISLSAVFFGTTFYQDINPTKRADSKVRYCVLVEAELSEVDISELGQEKQTQTLDTTRGK